MSHVFVSYSRQDSDFVIKLVRDIQKSRIDVWLDQLRIPTGEPWDQAVEDALYDASHFLLVMSSSSVESPNVRDELAVALDEDMTIIPIMIEPCRPPLRVRRRQYIKFHSTEYENALDQLTDTLRETIRPREIKHSKKRPPPNPRPEGLAIPSESLVNSISQVTFAAAVDDGRPVLTGVLFDYDGRTLNLVAADGFRLATTRIEVDMASSNVDPFSVVIPTEALGKLERGHATEYEYIYLDLWQWKHQDVFSFHLNWGEIEGAPLPGPFPEWRHLLGIPYSTSAMLSTNQLINACRSFYGMRKDLSSMIWLDFIPGFGKTGLLAVRNDLAANTEPFEHMIDARMEGSDLEIALNALFLLDGLEHIGSDQVLLRGSLPHSPLMVEPAYNNDYRYILMPMWNKPDRSQR